MKKTKSFANKTLGLNDTKSEYDMFSNYCNGLEKKLKTEQGMKEFSNNLKELDEDLQREVLTFIP